MLKKKRSGEPGVLMVITGPKVFDFHPSFGFFYDEPGQAHGKTLEDFVAQHQDRSKNALAKSHSAAYNAWVEELRADQAQFMSEKILCLGSTNDFLFVKRQLISI